jgi:flagellar biosynthetic protein FliQ
MTPETIVQIGQTALYVTIQIIGVMLVPALIVGLLISVFQAATQINEVTLSFIPKLLVTMLIVIVAGPWILRTLVVYTQRLFHDIPNLIWQ